MSHAVANAFRESQKFITHAAERQAADTIAQLEASIANEPTYVSILRVSAGGQMELKPVKQGSPDFMAGVDRLLGLAENDSRYTLYGQEIVEGADGKRCRAVSLVEPVLTFERNKLYPHIVGDVVLIHRHGMGTEDLDYFSSVLHEKRERELALQREEQARRHRQRQGQRDQRLTLSVQQGRATEPAWVTEGSSSSTSSRDQDSTGGTLVLEPSASVEYGIVHEEQNSVDSKRKTSERVYMEDEDEDEDDPPIALRRTKRACRKDAQE